MGILEKEIGKKYFKAGFYLLENQIESSKKNNDLLINFRYYLNKIDNTFLSNFKNLEDYFKNKVENNYFYIDKENFYLNKYPITKRFFGYRNYSFFSYELLLLYYSIGLYLLDVSKYIFDYVDKNLVTKKGDKKYKYFSGYKLEWDNEKIKNFPDTFSYKKQYKEFYNLIKKSSIKNGTSNKIVIKIDIQNFFDEINLKKLLDFLSGNIKNEIDLGYYENKKIEILEFFEYLGYSKGIPQYDGNIISSFLSNLYLIQSDLIILDFLNSLNIKYDFFRYVDDHYFIFELDELLFNNYDIYFIIHKIEDILFNTLNLNLNLNKLKVFNIKNDGDYQDFLKDIKNISLGNYLGDLDELVFDEKISKIKSILKKIKETSILYKIDDNNSILNYNIEGINELNLLFSKYEDSENLLNYFVEKEISFLIDFFDNFDFNLLNLMPKPLIALIKKTKDINDIVICDGFLPNIEPKKIYKDFYNYLLNMKIKSIQDLNILHKIIIEEKELFEKHENEILKSSYHFLKLFYGDNIVIGKNINNEYSHLIKYINQDLINQIKQKRIYEIKNDFSRAFNHLINEFQMFIKEKQKYNGKLDEFNKDKIAKELNLLGIDNNLILSIRNMFDRRNNNGISHGVGIGISKIEYYEYNELVKLIYSKIK